MLLPDPFRTPDLRAGDLHLRGYRAADAEWVSRLAGPFEVAQFTGLPHPMPLEAAEAWIGGLLEGLEQRTILAWGAHLNGDPVGSGTLRLRPEQGIARLGFWLAQDHWGCGHGRSIASALAEYAFDTLRVRRLEADCVSPNTASAKVLQSCGMKVEGKLRGGFHRFGATNDVTVFGALRSDFEAAKRS